MVRNERGQALMAVIAGISLVLITLTAGILIAQFSGKITQRQLTQQGQAINAAEAGLTEGLSWFQRQSTQPVTNFAPLLNTAIAPPILDTQNPGLGLVREYAVSGPGRVWAHYELLKTGIAGGTNTIDITTQRGKRGAGIVWQLESTGIVYANNNPAVAYNVSPNVVISRRTLRSEIQRLGLNRPADAALVANNCAAISLPNTAIEIRGNNASGIACVSSTGTPSGAGFTTSSNPPNSQITGGAGGAYNNGITALPNRFSIPYIFGMTLQELQNMANFQSTTVAALPYQIINGLQSLPPMQLILLNDPANQSQTYTFNSTYPLNGTGILVVFGNLVIAPNSDSNYNGMIVVVKGSYSQSAPSTVNGTVIVDSGAAGTITVQGAGDKSNMRFDSNLMAFVAQRMGVYNTIRQPYQP